MVIWDVIYAIFGEFLEVAPTEMTSSSVAGGVLTVEQPGPSFPADTDMKIPAVRRAATACEKVSREHPSFCGQPYEFPIACGRNSGFGLLPY